MHSSSSSSQISRVLRVAEGCLKLDLPEQSLVELEKLEGADRTSVEAWVMRCRIYRATKQWAAMGDVAKHLVSLDSGVADYWLEAAFAIRNTDGVGAAHQIMTPAVRRLPNEPQIRYRAACCAAQVGLFVEASDHLRAAVDKLYDLKHRALQDPDLEPLWTRAGI